MDDKRPFQPDARYGERHSGRNLARDKMSRDKPPNSFSSGDAPPDDIKCPICGAWESKGGCENPSICARALAKMETDYSREITELLAKENERPLHLLMAGLEALNLLNIGLAVTTASGLLLMSNRSFDQMLAANDGLKLSSGGVLQAQEGSSPLFSELLQRAHIHAAAGKVRQPAVIAVTRAFGQKAAARIHSLDQLDSRIGRQCRSVGLGVCDGPGALSGGGGDRLAAAVRSHSDRG